ncbi:MAG: septum formation initiator family protein [Anaeromyxobacteraceae bacterium]
MSAPLQRKWIFLFLGAVALLAAASALDPSGFRKHQRLAAEVERMRAENVRLDGENARLAREAVALRSDPAAIERAVREELRFVRPGEMVIRTDREGGTPP